MIHVMNDQVDLILLIVLIDQIDLVVMIESVVIDLWKEAGGSNVGIDPGVWVVSIILPYPQSGVKMNVLMTRHYNPTESGAGWVNFSSFQATPSPL